MVARACALVGLLFLGTALAGAGQEPSAPVDRAELLGSPAGPPLEGAELDRRTEELAARMRCPVCQALSVADSPSLSALAMKEEIRDLLAAGYSEDQVIGYFEQAYGEFIRLEPKAEGFNLFVWTAPVALLLLGLVVVALRLRRATTTTKESDGPTRRPAASGDLDGFRERVRREIGA